MSKNLKILEVCNQDRFLASPYMLPFLTGLVRRGHVVEAACRVTDAAGFLEEAGVAVHDLAFTRSLTPAADLRVYRQLKALLSEGDYDLVHTHTPKDGIMGRRAAWKLGVPAVVHTCNGFYFSDASPRVTRWVVMRAEKYAARRCHRIIFVNGEDMALAAEKKMARPGLFQYIPNGTDLRRFRAGEEPGLWEELSIPPDARVVGYVGEMTAEKNQAGLIEALAALRSRHEGLFAVLVGDAVKQPAAMRECRERAEKLGVADHVVFAGYRRDVERFYRVFDVYAHPSLREGFGVPLIEAMASEVPVVACRVRGPREIVTDGFDGILVEPGDAAELADAIAFYLEEAEAAGDYSSRALAMVREHYDLEKVHTRLFSLYDELSRQVSFSGVSP